MPPFKSLKQERWAFVNHKDFAKKWAAITDQSSLPQKVKKKKSKKNQEGK